MCTSWNQSKQKDKKPDIITYWEMCTSWNQIAGVYHPRYIITYWEMCTSWNTYHYKERLWQDYNLLGNVH